MPTRSNRKRTKSNQVIQQTTIEEEEVISMLKQKHEIEMEESRLKQAKEELTGQM